MGKAALTEEFIILIVVKYSNIFINNRDCERKIQKSSNHIEWS